MASSNSALPVPLSKMCLFPELWADGEWPRTDQDPQTSRLVYWCYEPRSIEMRVELDRVQPHLFPSRAPEIVGLTKCPPGGHWKADGPRPRIGSSGVRTKGEPEAMRQVCR
jgi:hypothetical protein